MDGTHSGSEYKQKFSSQKSQDSAVFTSYMCPLSLKSPSEILFVNDKPGDSQKCRPLVLMYERETKDLTVSEFKKLEAAFENCEPIPITFFSETDQAEIKFNATLKAYPTMFDGKCLNAILENNATTRCRGCKETNKDFASNLNISMFYYNFKQHIISLKPI